MKKLIALSAFIMIGFAAAYAQGPATTKTSAKPTPALQATSATATIKPMEATAETVVTGKPGAKKECSADEKKACSTKGKKSCCSKAAATETKPANQ